MLIGERLRKLREAKNLTQVDIEKRVGLRKSYISRVEHGFKAPQVETLKKFSIALEVPLCEIFNQKELPPERPLLMRKSMNAKFRLRASRKESRYFAELIRAVARIGEADRRILLSMARKMARHGYRDVVPGPSRV